MAWCRQATTDYLSYCWARSLPSYGVTRPQWVNCILRLMPGVEIWAEICVHFSFPFTWIICFYTVQQVGQWNRVAVPTVAPNCTFPFDSLYLVLTWDSHSYSQMENYLDVIVVSSVGSVFVLYWGSATNSASGRHLGGHDLQLCSSSEMTTGSRNYPSTSIGHKKGYPVTGWRHSQFGHLGPNWWKWRM